MTVTEIGTSTTVRIDAAALKAAMAKLKPAMPRATRYTNPVLQSVYVITAADKVIITATDLTLTLSTAVPTEAGSTGSCLVPAAVITKLLSVRSKGTVEITSAGDTGFVKAGNLKLEFEPEDVGQFPLPGTVEGREVELNLAILPELLPAVSTDDTRPILCSVYIDSGTYAATDSYRLHIVDIGTDTGDPFLLPRDAAQVMAKYPTTVTATVSDRHLRVALDESTTLITRLQEGEFPFFRRLIPEAPPQQITFTDALIGDLKDAMKARQESDSKTPVKITSTGFDELELAIGTGRKRTVVTTTGTSTLPDGIAFAPPYLLDLLTGTTSNELRVTDSLKPALLREPAPTYGDDAERIRLIMPVRIS